MDTRSKNGLAVMLWGLVMAHFGDIGPLLCIIIGTIGCFIMVSGKGER